ncbi:hypothetical protein [Novosphingobium pentaromativorans]
MNDAQEAMHYVAPVGEKAEYVKGAASVVSRAMAGETIAAG